MGPLQVEVFSNLGFLFNLKPLPLALSLHCLKKSVPPQLSAAPLDTGRTQGSLPRAFFSPDWTQPDSIADVLQPPEPPLDLFQHLHVLLVLEAQSRAQYCRQGFIRAMQRGKITSHAHADPDQAQSPLLPTLIPCFSPSSF